MEELVLVRHGFAGSNDGGVASCRVPGDGLTSDGVAQARALSVEIASEDLDLAVASQLARTQETLALVLEGRDVPVVIVPELDEIHFGSFDGGPLEVYRAWAAAHPPDVPPPGDGESRAEAAARYARALRLVHARREPRVLLVGHALMLRYTLDAANGLVPAARMAPVQHALPYRLSTDAVERAATLLEGWSRSPAFRDPSIEG